MKKYLVTMTETYAKTYEVEAVDLDEACEKAERLAAADNTIGDINNFRYREMEHIELIR